MRSVHVRMLDRDRQRRRRVDGAVYSGEIVETGLDGEVVSTSTVVDGLLHGAACTWFPDGRLRSETTMVHEVPTGVERTWHHNGRLAEERHRDVTGDTTAIRRWDQDGNVWEPRQVDLDDRLTALVGVDEDPALWSEPRAVGIAEEAAAALGLWIQYEPGDEEWAIWHRSGGPYVGMISVRFPLAIVTEVVAPRLREQEPEVGLEIIEDFMDEELRASPELLRRTLLRWGWGHDFDTEGFSANDLFFESV